MHIDLASDIDLKKLFAGLVSEHADQGIVDLDETALGSGEKDAFLNGVEQLAIAPLRFLPIGNVLEDMNGLLVIGTLVGNLGSRDEIGAIEGGVDILVDAAIAVGAERAMSSGSIGSKSEQGLRGQTDEFPRSDSDEVRESSIDAQDPVFGVVHQDEVADSVEHLNPVVIGLVHAGEEARIFNGKRQLIHQRGKNIGNGDLPVGKAQNAEQSAIGRGEPGDGDFMPGKIGGHLDAQDVLSQAGDDDELYWGAQPLPEPVRPKKAAPNGLGDAGRETGLTG